MSRITAYVSKVCLLIIVLVPALVFGHEGHTASNTFAKGLAHPIGGLDHLLAMVAVGFWASHLGGHARWQLPLAFVVAMVIGGTLGANDLVAPLLSFATEPMIVASSIVIGLLLAINGRLKALPATSLCGAFALFHGLAHGNEIPLNSSALAYTSGFALATAALHGLGLLSGMTARLIPGGNRWIGSLIAISGLFLATV
jgi:urease accessory protein